MPCSCLDPPIDSLRMIRTDLQNLFESALELYLVLLPNTEFTITAASRGYLDALKTQRDQIIGRGIFDVLSDNADAPAVVRTRDLRESLERVLHNRVPDTMAIRKHDIRRLECESSGCEERYWSAVNSPVFSLSGDLVYIIH